MTICDHGCFLSFCFANVIKSHLTTFKTWSWEVDRARLLSQLRDGMAMASAPVAPLPRKGDTRLGCSTPGPDGIYQDNSRYTVILVCKLYTQLYTSYIICVYKKMQYCIARTPLMTLCTQHSKPCPDQMCRYGRTNLAGQSMR